MPTLPYCGPAEKHLILKCHLICLLVFLYQMYIRIGTLHPLYTGVAVIHLKLLGKICKNASLAVLHLLSSQPLCALCVIALKAVFSSCRFNETGEQWLTSASIITGDGCCRYPRWFEQSNFNPWRMLLGLIYSFLRSDSYSIWPRYVEVSVNGVYVT